jgi:hypothetical protein
VPGETLDNLTCFCIPEHNHIRVYASSRSHHPLSVTAERQQITISIQRIVECGILGGWRRFPKPLDEVLRI